MTQQTAEEMLAEGSPLENEMLDSARTAARVVMQEAWERVMYGLHDEIGDAFEEADLDPEDSYDDIAEYAWGIVGKVEKERAEALLAGT